MDPSQYTSTSSGAVQFPLTWLTFTTSASITHTYSRVSAAPYMYSVLVPSSADGSMPAMVTKAAPPGSAPAVMVIALKFSPEDEKS
ncbi:Uncharacterised protein [uncultured archaeon]|nr:Uncharacterised protein [uncultured archaeon]